MKKYKVFFIVRDIVSWLQPMIETCQKWNLEPIILDNNSSYKPLLEYYRQKPCRVIRFNQNFGNNVLYATGTLQQEVGPNERYILSDPDLMIDHLPDDTIEKFEYGLEKYSVIKVGPAIQIDDMPDEYILKEQVLIWETPFWSNPLGEDYYNAPLDTTFALYKPGINRHTIGGLRVGGAYTCKHMPFYLTPDNITDELAYYFSHCDRTKSSQGQYIGDWILENYGRKTATVKA